MELYRRKAGRLRTSPRSGQRGRRLGGQLPQLDSSGGRMTKIKIRKITLLYNLIKKK